MGNINVLGRSVPITVLIMLSMAVAVIAVPPILSNIVEVHVSTVTILTLHATPTSVTFNETVHFTGDLIKDGVGLADKTITIHENTQDFDVAIVTTDQNGHFTHNWVANKIGDLAFQASYQP